MRTENRTKQWPFLIMRLQMISPLRICRWSSLWRTLAEVSQGYQEKTVSVIGRHWKILSLTWSILKRLTLHCPACTSIWADAKATERLLLDALLSSQSSQCYMVVETLKYNYSIFLLRTLISSGHEDDSLGGAACSQHSTLHFIRTDQNVSSVQQVSPVWICYFEMVCVYGLARPVHQTYHVYATPREHEALNLYWRVGPAQWVCVRLKPLIRTNKDAFLTWLFRTTSLSHCLR